MSQQGPIILTLSSWTEQRMTELFQATSKEQFQQAFNNFVSKHVDITVNGQKVTRSHFETQLWNAQSNKRSADVKFAGIVEVPKDADQPLKGGEVGVFAKVTIYLKDVVLGKPADNIMTSSYNFVILPDQSIIGENWPKNAGIGPVITPYFDERRVTVINSVSVDQPDKIIPLTRPEDGN